MAPRTPPVSNHYLAQAGLLTALGQTLTKLWAGVDPAHLSGELPKLKAQILAHVIRYAKVAASLAARNYTRARAASGAVGAFQVPIAGPPPVEQILASIDWATADLTDSASQSDIDTALTKTEGVAARLVADAARETTTAAAEADENVRWARETAPDACYFCSMLATRGAVYHSDASAGDAEVNQYHDHCRCQPIPVFGDYIPPAYVRKWEDDWARVTGGKSGSSARLAWRRHIEGRDAPPHST